MLPLIHQKGVFNSMDKSKNHLPDQVPCIAGSEASPVSQWQFKRKPAP